MRLCAACKNLIDDDGDFCDYCGSQVAVQSAPSNPISNNSDPGWSGLPADPDQSSEPPPAQPTAAEPRSQWSSLARLLIIVGTGSTVLLGTVLILVVTYSLKGAAASNEPAIVIKPTATPSPSPRLPPGLLYVPGGEFVMGDDTGDEYSRPAHRVKVKPFFIATHEVTCDEYRAFIEATGHKAPAGWINRRCRAGTERHPITGVDWHDATAYAEWAGMRLPTEEEWELAARGFDQRTYPWGNAWMPDAANAGVSSAGRLTDVGSHARGKSPFGALDMVGNAWEWTSTDVKPYPGGTLSRPPSQERKIMRGGSWVRASPADWNTTFRGFAAPRGGRDYSKTGFRCARSAS
jgi:formylglycine-generating enzyme required for sulfatase activity